MVMGLRIFLILDIIFCLEFMSRRVKLLEMYLKKSN